MLYIFGLIVSLMCSSLAYGHGEVANSGQVFKEVEVTQNISMLQGKGGNIALVKGEQGLLLIDDDYKVNVGALEQFLQKKDAQPRFIINTHWHGDHTGGNAHLGEYVTIVAHDNVRKRLSMAQEIKLFGMKVEPSPASALPVVTFAESLSLHFNGQSLNVVHYPNGHTDGDSVVFFQPANVVHMGDHYFSGIFPFVDVENGGDVLGMAQNVAAIIKRLNPETKVIPGHGPLSSLDDLEAYHEMLVTTVAVVKKAIDKGLSLAEIVQQGLPEKWQAWGRGFINQDTWIKIIYSSLTKAG